MHTNLFVLVAVCAFSWGAGLNLVPPAFGESPTQLTDPGATAEPFVELAELHRRSGETSVARRYFELALAADAGNTRARRGLEKLKESPGPAESGSLPFRELMAKVGRSPRLSLQLLPIARSRLDAGDAADAKAMLIDCVRLDPENAEAQLALGEASERLAKAAEKGSSEWDRHTRFALASYEMYSNMRPESAQGWARAGEIWFHLLDGKRAREALQKAHALAPQDARIRKYLADAELVDRVQNPVDTGAPKTELAYPGPRPAKP